MSELAAILQLSGDILQDNLYYVLYIELTSVIKSEQWHMTCCFILYKHPASSTSRASTSDTVVHSIHKELFMIREMESQSRGPHVDAIGRICCDKHRGDN